MKLSRTRNANGFTIVELLIVIVIIAILSAISVITYNGVTQRAENTKTINGVSQTVRALKTIRAEQDAYPLTGGGFNYACIAELNEPCAYISGTADSSCAAVSAATGTDADGGTVFNTSIKNTIRAMPKVSTQDIQCENKIVRGALYYVFGGADKNAYIIYYLKGSQTCVAPGGSTLTGTVPFGTTITRCTITMGAN